MSNSLDPNQDRHVVSPDLDPSLLSFFKISSFKKFFPEHYQSVKQFEFRSGPEVIRLFSCSTQLSMKFILLVNVKMQKIVGILTCISMINRTSERLKERNFFICPYFSFYEQDK